jgi:hypothetical protein
LKLPGADRVRIDDLKVRGYLLSPTHPVGRFKARVFASAGFGDSTAELFISELRRIAVSGQVERTEDIEFGRKYTVPGELRGPAGVVQVLTVWIQGPDEAAPRLVTVHPR